MRHIRRPRAGPVVCHPARMLRELRAESGAPHFGTRLLALVLVLLLGGPLTYYLVRGAMNVLHLAL